MIYLVRHGQTNWNKMNRVIGHTDVPMNSKGIEQINNLKYDFISCDVDRIISSDLSRTMKTAQLLNEVLDCDIIYDDRLRGYNYGLLEGLYRKNLTIVSRLPNYLGVEKNEHVYNRIKDFFENTDLSGNTIIVTHGGTIRMILYYLFNKEFYDSNIFELFYEESFVEHGKYIMYDGENITYEGNKRLYLK